MTPVQQFFEFNWLAVGLCAKAEHFLGVLPLTQK